MDVAELCHSIDECISKVAELQAENAALRKRVERLEEALGPLAAIAEAGGVPRSMNPAEVFIWAESNTRGPAKKLSFADAIEAKAAIEDK